MLADRPVLVDGHVHFHRGFDPAAFLTHARDNVEAAAHRLGLESSTMGVLCFTESAGVYYFRRFRETALGGGGYGPWQLSSAGEARSVYARRADGATLLLVAGRQIITREGLEVLALGAEHEIEDGGSLPDTVDAVQASHAVPVLPWGFGKWWFRRGRVLRGLLASTRGDRVFLGDNGGRLGVAPTPKLFAVARAVGWFVLPGSDPLPFASQQSRAGSFGFVLPDAVSGARPAASLVDALRALTTQPLTYGRLENVAGFITAQVGMQLRKHLRRAS